MLGDGLLDVVAVLDEEVFDALYKVALDDDDAVFYATAYATRGLEVAAEIVKVVVGADESGDEGYLFASTAFAFEVDMKLLLFWCKGFDFGFIV